MRVNNNEMERDWLFYDRNACDFPHGRMSFPGALGRNVKPEPVYRYLLQPRDSDAEKLKRLTRELHKQFPAVLTGEFPENGYAASVVRKAPLPQNRIRLIPSGFCINRDVLELHLKPVIQDNHGNPGKETQLTDTLVIIAAGISGPGFPCEQEDALREHMVDLLDALELKNLTYELRDAMSQE